MNETLSLQNQLFLGYESFSPSPIEFLIKKKESLFFEDIKSDVSPSYLETNESVLLLLHGQQLGL